MYSSHVPVAVAVSFTVTFVKVKAKQHVISLNIKIQSLHGGLGLDRIQRMIEREVVGRQAHHAVAGRLHRSLERFAARQHVVEDELGGRNLRLVKFVRLCACATTSIWSQWYASWM